MSLFTGVILKSMTSKKLKVNGFITSQKFMATNYFSGNIFLLQID